MRARCGALEIGVNDYPGQALRQERNPGPRAHGHFCKKRYTERLRDNVQLSIQMAITDALTGLFNRRYMESHLATLVEQAASRGKPLVGRWSLDIDYFKAINDSHGHDAGDDVLRDFALRIKRSIRGIDLACRYGGEEFVVVMPETDMAVAAMVGGAAAPADRRRAVSDPAGRARRSGDDLDRDCRACAARTTPPASVLKRADAGALSGQARRAQPGGRPR